jgi:4-hydroxybenzoate polyprenyltransferase
MPALCGHPGSTQILVFQTPAQGGGDKSSFRFPLFREKQNKSFVRWCFYNFLVPLGMSFTDIRFDLIEKLPLAARPYALLMRLDRPTGWWLLLLPGWWAISLAGGGIDAFDFRQWYMLFLFFIGAVVMRGAGCIINDLWDRELDAKVERTKLRPLASGEVKIWQAAAFLCCLLFIGLFVLVQMPAISIWIGFLSMVFVIAYPYMKRVTWWPQAFLGVTFNFGVPIGWAASSGGLAPEAALMYLGAFFWTLGYDTIYAHQDRDDDQMVGIKSTALLFGERSKKWVGIFYAAAWGLIALSAFLGGASILSLGLLVLPGLHLLLQVILWKPDSPADSLRWFKSNRDCGLLFFLGFLCA